MGRFRFLILLIILLAFDQSHAQRPKPFYWLSITPATDTILAGASVTVTAMVKDTLGNEYPSYASYILWGIHDSLKDYHVSIRTDTVILTSTKAHHNIEVDASITNVGGFPLGNRSIITMVPNKPYQVNIEKDSVPASFWNTDSTDTVRVTSYSSTLRLYAIERDTFGNYIRMAENSSWTPLRSGIFSVSSPLGIKGEADISAIDSGICPLAVRDSTLAADTVYIYVTNPPTVITQFPISIGKGNTNNVRELYDLKGRKLCRSANYGISGAYIVKVGYICNKRARIAGSRDLNFFR